MTFKSTYRHLHPRLYRVSLLPMKMSLVCSYSLQKEQGHTGNNNDGPCLIVLFYKRLCCQQRKIDDGCFWAIIVQTALRQTFATSNDSRLQKCSAFGAFCFAYFAFHVQLRACFSKRLAHRTLQLTLTTRFLSGVVAFKVHFRQPCSEKPQ